MDGQRVGNLDRNSYAASCNLEIGNTQNLARLVSYL